MYRRAFAISVALIGIGLGSYVGTGGVSETALIPALFGVAIGAAAWVARRSDRPFVWEVAAIGFAALATLGCLPGLLRLPELLAGSVVARPGAVAAQAATALLCGLFVVLSLGDVKKSGRRSGRDRRHASGGAA